MAHAEDCKSFYIGSIPVPASKSKKRYFFSCKKNFKGVYLSVLFRCSSVVEQSAVNRSVVGSSPTAGAIKEAAFLRPLFIFPFSAAIFALSVFVFALPFAIFLIYYKNCLKHQIHHRQKKLLYFIDFQKIKGRRPALWNFGKTSQNNVFSGAVNKKRE